MNQYINNKIKKSKRNYLSSGNFYKIRKFKYKILILFTIILFSLVFIIDLPVITNIKSEDTQIPIEKNLELSNQENNIFKLIYGTSAGPPSLDPQDSWDSASMAVIDQVCEGLFGYNLSDPDLAIIPKLASDNGTWNGENYTVPLRQGVFFHDGTKFNATAVNFTFNRLAYFMENGLAMASSLYEYYDVGTSSILPLINHTEIIDEYTIKFVMNKPYGLIEALLCFFGSYILSPASTNATGVIDALTGDLIGTGPFVYDYYIEDDEVKFHAFENYWAGKPNITILKFSIILDEQERNNALLSGEVDIITDPMSSMLPIFDTDSDITLFNDNQSSAVQYLGMNNHWINVSFRKAISYAINYSYIIEELLGGEAVRLKSPIAERIKFANWSFNVATYNVSYARTIMQSMGFGIGFTTDVEWQAATFATFNYTYNIGNQFREDVLVLLQDNLDLIGIDVTDEGMTFTDYINRLYEGSGLHRNMLQLYWLGWGPDYNDPSNFINPLFTNRTIASNGAKYNGGYGPDGPFQPYGPLVYDQNEDVQLLMEQALFETDPSIREPLYDKIQQLIVERDMPWAFGYVRYNFDAYQNYILGFQSNALGQLRFHGVYQNSSIASKKKIHIEGNQEWTYFRNAEKCTGAGTYSDPYIIEDLVIDGENSSSCISIENSTVYFRIENCTLYNSGSSDDGIKLYLVGNGTLINNNFSFNNGNGIFLLASNNNTVSRNTAISNGDYGIYLSNTNNTLVNGNNLKSNGLGGYLDDNGNNNDFIWNVNNGFADPFIIDDIGGGDFTWAQATNQLAWVTGSGLYSDPYIIEDLIIDGLNSSSCILIENSNVYSKIEDCTLYNASSLWSKAGITLHNVSNSQLIDNNCSYNNGDGIVLWQSHNNTIMGNTASNSEDGLYFFQSNNNIISGNTVNNNSAEGMDIVQSNNNTISGNGVYANTKNGIQLSYSNNTKILGNIANYNYQSGIGSGYSSNITISGNTANSNENHGIYIGNCNNVTISGNTVHHNDPNGITIWESNNAIVSSNTVYSNTHNGINLLGSNVSKISGNNVYNNDEVGIFSIMGNNIEILGNTVNNNNWHGILFHDSSECTVMRNTANNNNYEGIKIENSDNFNVIGNILNSNGAPYHDYMGSNNDFLWNVADGYTDPIVFDDSGAGDFTWTEATNQLAWFTGSGTSINPYLIENININSQNSGSCVEVINSNAYLIIRNSEFTNSGSGTSDAGIILAYVTTATTELTNLNCSYNNGYGIILSDCDNVHIEDCTISNNGFDGIALINSDFNSIQNNDETINYNSGYGISLSNSDGNSIVGNNINYNDEYGIILSDSSNNAINNNDLRYNINGDYIVQGSSTGNTFGDGNTLDPVPGDNMFLIIVIVIVSIIALTAVIGGVALKKRSSKPKKVKEKKSELPLEERAALRILEERKQTEKQKQKAEEKERKIERDLLKRMATIDFLIKENKIETALNSLVKIQEEAQGHGFTDVIKTSQERMDLCQNLQEEISKQEKLKEEERSLQEKLKEEERLEKERLIEEEKKKKEFLKEEERLEKERLEKEKERQRAIGEEAIIKEGFQKRISNIDYLLKENKTETAINILVEIQKEAQDQGLEDIVNTTEEKIIECKKLELNTVNRIKQTILNLGAKFTRLQLLDISEKSGIPDEALIESVIQDMIRKKEIQGEYFIGTKALALEVKAPIPVEEKAAGKNVFISYSTLDTDYFQVSKIVRRLELYPEINRVIFWEADSQQNIVEFMEETLRITNAFILFCSENSFKSGAVKGEWQSAYQMVKKGLMKMIPVYEDEDHIPRLLWNMLNVKFSKEDFEGFIQKLYEEILR